MGQLYIVRHGETHWNRQGRIQGHTDVPLSDRGQAQARLTADRLRPVPLDAAYASDLSRAAHTAAIILEGRQVPLHTTPQLREYHKGAFEGLTEPQLRAQHPTHYPGYLAKDLDYAPPNGGESVRDVCARITPAINQIRHRHLTETVLIVGHGGSLRAAMMTLLGMPPDANWRFIFNNCALTILDTHPDNTVLRLFNDTSHLTPPRED